jgi:hypothetical protein
MNNVVLAQVWLVVLQNVLMVHTVEKEHIVHQKVMVNACKMDQHTVARDLNAIMDLNVFTLVAIPSLVEDNSNI